MPDDTLGSTSRRRFLQISAASIAVAPSLAAAEEEPLLAQGPTSTVAKYIVTRLHQHGALHLFGVPGATCDPLFAAAAEGPIEVVVNASDLEAGYAADGYARVRGLGAVAVTYGVGTMSLLSVVAGAYAERSPLVIVNGGPSSEDLRVQRELGSYFSHSIGKEKTDLTLFREVTGYAERAARASDVPRVVDEAIAVALRQKLPVYVEIAKHVWNAACPSPAGTLDVEVKPTGDEDRTAAEIVGRLRKASAPLVLVGIEAQRYGLADDVIDLLARLGVPWSSTYLAKSTLPETTPGFVGVYNGERALPSVKKAVEGADALLGLGCVLGRQYRALAKKTSPKSLMLVAKDVARLAGRPPAPVALPALVKALARAAGEKRPAPSTSLSGLSFDERRRSLGPPRRRASAEPGLTYDAVLKRVSDALDDTLIAVTDTSLSMYPAADLEVAGRNGFVCNAVWQAIGFSVGAAVGIGVGGARRPIVLCGDGGFQMTAQSLSTMARRRMRSIVIVLDNGHYGIEQFLLDPSYFAGSAPPLPYLGLNRWGYADFARSLGFDLSTTVVDEAGFARALEGALASEGPAFIAARIQPHDLPSQLHSRS